MSVRRNPSSPNVVQVTVDAFTSWYIQDLMVVKEDIEEYKFQIPSPMTIPWYAPFHFINSISKGTCAQGKLRYFPLEPWIKPQTLQQRHYHRTHSSDIANPCVNSNPRCPSKGVWDILYYGTYVTAVFLKRWKCALTFWAKIASPRFLAVSLLRFHMTRTVFFEPVLEKDFSGSRTWLYPKIWMLWRPNRRCKDLSCKLSFA
jgi:hypothetical protein